MSKLLANFSMVLFYLAMKLFSNMVYCQYKLAFWDFHVGSFLKMEKGTHHLLRDGCPLPDHAERSSYAPSILVGVIVILSPSLST